MKIYEFVLIILFNSLLVAQTFKLIGPPNRYGILEFQKNNPSILYVANINGGLTRSTDDGRIKELLHPGIDRGGPEQLYTLNNDTGKLFYNTNGYLFKTTDTGISWAYDDGDIYAPAFVLANPLNVSIIYKYQDYKIYKSFDKGINWNYLYTFPYKTLYPTFTISPADTSIIYIALANGYLLSLFKSTNAGNDWTEVLHNGNFPSAYKMDINPNNPNSLYIQLGGDMYKSLDGGETFNHIGPPAISVFTFDYQDTLTIYFISRDPFYHPNGLFAKTTNEGQTWFDLNTKFPEYVFFDNMVINPIDHSEIYTLCDIGTFKSTDSGNNWDEVFLGGENTQDYYIDKNISDKIITPSSLYGFKMTTDGGDTWFIPGIDEPLRYAGRTAHNFAFRPDDTDIGFLTTDSLLYQTTDGGFNWFKNNYFTYKFAKTIAISPVDPNIILICTIDSPEGIAKLYLSRDGGDNWELRNYLGGWYFGFEQMEFDPVDVNKVYLKKHTGDSLLVTTNLGLTWTNAGTGLSNSAYISQIWINPNNHLEMYCSERVGSGSPGTFNMSTNAGESWFQIDSVLKAIDEWCDVSSFWIDPENTDRIYLSLHEHSQFPTSSYTSGGIYFTDNHGQSWMKIFDSYADKIKADNSAPRNLYFDSKYGLLVLKDTLVTDVKEHTQVFPNKFALFQNYPNPFNPYTTIEFEVPQNEYVKIEIYNMLGQKVKTMLDKEVESGKHKIEFNALGLSSGVYLYQLKAGEFINSKKMILLK
jgi:photosystem II stability/assembly factor-like uncharacterized protein